MKLGASLGILGIVGYCLYDVITRKRIRPERKEEKPVVVQSDFGIVCIFDQVSHEKILKLQNQLVGEGVSPLPHITLSFTKGQSLNSMKYEQLASDLEIVASRTSCFNLNFPSIGSFPSGGVVFLAPQVTDDLLQLHKDVHKIIKDHGAISQPYFIANQWTPHCTLGNYLPRHDVIACLTETMEKFSFPFVAQVIGITFQYFPAGAIHHSNYKGKAFYFK